MALPDLDTSNISWIAFFNYLDNGADDIDPFETESAMDSYNEYSNGVDGVISYSTDQPNVEVKVRAKADGWLIAWHDDTEPLIQIVADYSDQDSGHYPISSGLLYQSIDSMESALSNSGQVSLSDGDEAVYNYNYPDATTYTCASISNGNGESFSSDIGLSSDISVQKMHVGGAASTGISFAGNTVVSAGNYGYVDPYNQGWISEGESKSADTGEYDACSVPILWA